ncbi:MAG: outer membrane protein transport protein [Bacteroidota bacterium]
MCTRLSAALLVSTLVAALVTNAAAQTNTENFAQFRFNFNNPGARATGIGGAFISIADDATAAEANPAGLTTIIRPEVSFETKGIKFTQKVSNFSHTGTSANFVLVEKKFSRSLISPSFGSVVFPVRRFTFSAFRHELVNFESAFFTKGSFVSTVPPTSPFFPASYFPVKAENTLKVVNWGAAVSYKVSGMFSLGISGGLSTISMKSSLSRYFLEVFTDGNIANVATIDDTGTDFFINAGVIVKPSENFAIGAIFKRRPSFSLTHSFRFTDFPKDSTRAKKINFNVPMSAGIGVSYRPLDELTLSLDGVWIAYSQLIDDFVLTISEESSRPSDYKVDDGFEIHGGAEYVMFLRSIGIVLRAGFYTEPDNRIRWVGNVNDTADPNRTFARQLLAGLFLKGDSYIHTTFGLGLVLSNSFQLDVAGNISAVTDELVGSVVVRF